MKKMNNKGFSLVELIVVIAIMAVFVGIAAPQFMGYTTRAKISTDIQNVATLLNAVDIYVADAGLDTDAAISALVTVQGDATNGFTGVNVDATKVKNVSNVTFKYTSWKSVVIKYENGKWTVAGETDTVNGTTYKLNGTN